MKFHSKGVEEGTYFGAEKNWWKIIKQLVCNEGSC
ncbi:hypothetical protein H5410_035053 [Solanum commersonii]|uniref:Uncharacterized protein n=1 Tax=Solanum commersonii TaxID=4109 RepID=A0A9J5Y0V9_SOLCO|nr:hypothetical protein H5410_035053 [Solanum commersonii]